MTRIEELENDIQKYSQLYYSDGSSPISDSEFDAMVDELKILNPDSEIFKTGWGYNVNLDSTPGEKYKHKYGQAGSLDKFRNFEELRSGLKSYENFDVSLKLDGLSVILYYQSGKLYQALTRGDGTTGIDITSKIKSILKNTDLSDMTFTGAVRGEILMSYSDFDEYKKLHPEAKNPRNSAAGIINSNGLSSDLKFLNVIVYSVIGYEGSENMATMHEVRQWLLKNFGIDNIVYHAEVSEFYDDGLLNQERLNTITQSLKSKWYNQYPADGLVFSTRDLIYNIRSNEVIQTAVAFKFESEKKQTKVLGVEWNLSKTRYLIPKVKIETVQLAGTDVSYTTGFNAKFIKDSGIGVGAIVEVTKRNEIIPNVDRVIKKVDPYIPTKCPECGSALEWNGVNIQCPNELCGNASRQDLSVWIENIAPIDGLGDAIKFKFLEQIFGKDLSVETVMNYKDKTVKMMFTKGGHKQLVSEMFNKLYGNCDDNSIELKNALSALNIPRLGDITASKLSKYPDVIYKLIQYPDLSFGDWFDMLSPIVGEATTNSIYRNIDKFLRLKLIQDRINWTPNDDNIQFKGKVAITGKLSVKRSDFEKELNNAGYSVGDITKDTKFLITDDPNSSSSKNLKADKLNIVKITEKEFRSKYMKY